MFEARTETKQSEHPFITGLRRQEGLLGHSLELFEEGRIPALNISGLTRRGKIPRTTLTLLPDAEDYSVQQISSKAFAAVARPTRMDQEYYKSLARLAMAAGLTAVVTAVAAVALEPFVQHWIHHDNLPVLPLPAHSEQLEQPRAEIDIEPEAVIDPDSTEARLFFFGPIGEEVSQLSKGQETASILFKVARELGTDPFRLIYTAYLKTGLNPDATNQRTVIIGNRAVAGPTEKGPLLITEDVLQRGWEEYAKFNGVPAECGTDTIQGCFIHIKAEDPSDAARAVGSAEVWNQALVKWGPLPDTAKDYDDLLEYLKQKGSEAVSLFAFDGSRVDMRVFPLIEGGAETQFIQAERPEVLDLTVPENSITFDQMHPEIDELTIVQLGDRILQIGDIVLDFNSTTALQAAVSLAQSRQPQNSPRQMSAQEKYLEAQGLIPKIETLISATGRNPQKYMNIMLCESGFDPDAENGKYIGLAQFSRSAWTRLTGISPSYIRDWLVHTLAFLDGYDKSPGEWECRA